MAANNFMGITGYSFSDCGYSGCYQGRKRSSIRSSKKRPYMRERVLEDQGA